jgi:hypothetical protein
MIYERLETNELSPVAAPAYCCGEFPVAVKGKKYPGRGWQTICIEEIELRVWEDQGYLKLIGQSTIKENNSTKRKS